MINIDEYRFAEFIDKCVERALEIDRLKEKYKEYDGFRRVTYMDDEPYIEFEKDGEVFYIPVKEQTFIGRMPDNE